MLKILKISRKIPSAKNNGLNMSEFETVCGSPVEFI